MKHYKYESGERLKTKIHIPFYGDSSRAAALRQTEFGTIEGHGHTYKFNLNHYFV
jgi:hypothetical protein